MQIRQTDVVTSTAENLQGENVVCIGGQPGQIACREVGKGWRDRGLCGASRCDNVIVLLPSDVSAFHARLDILDELVVVLA